MMYSKCKRGEGPRSIQIDPTLEAYRAQARSNLNSEMGMLLRKQRGADVEPVFGDIKFNQGYHRCRLRGQAKANVEVGLLSIARNTKKIALAPNPPIAHTTCMALPALYCSTMSKNFWDNLGAAPRSE